MREAVFRAAPDLRAAPADVCLRAREAAVLFGAAEPEDKVLLAAAGEADAAAVFAALVWPPALPSAPAPEASPDVAEASVLN